MNAKFFSTATKLHSWLLRNYDKSDELWIGFYKKASGKKSISYAEALDEALCFGWIDGLKKSLDDDSYMMRFTPRSAKSVWSAINVKHFARLKKEGRVHPSGFEAFARHDSKKTKAIENRARTLSPELEKIFRKNKKAWDFFQNQSPYLIEIGALYVMSAKKEETRLRRLQKLIEASGKGEYFGKSH